MTAFCGNVSPRPDSVCCVSLLWPIAQSLREPFSPRSSEPIHPRLAIVLLRVCAPEVKKKFQKRDMKKRWNRKIYFVEKFCDERALSGAAKNALEVLAPASRRQYKTLRSKAISLTKDFPMTIGRKVKSKDYGVSLR